MEIKRRILPGIEELIKSNLDGDLGKIIDKIKLKLKERNVIVDRINKCFGEWSALFVELNKADGALDELEVMAIENSKECDIINKIREGCKKADNERMKQFRSITEQHGSSIGHAGPFNTSLLSSSYKGFFK